MLHLYFYIYPLTRLVSHRPASPDWCCDTRYLMFQNNSMFSCFSDPLTYQQVFFPEKRMQRYDLFSIHKIKFEKKSSLLI